jgi:hypothetical protein
VRELPHDGHRWVDTSRGAVHVNFGEPGGVRVKVGGRHHSLEPGDSLTDFLTRVAELPSDEAKEVARIVVADWQPGSGEKTGIAYIDVGWHRRIWEWHGVPPTHEPEVTACWNVEDDTNPQRLADTRGFEDADEALAWARERAPLVLVRLGSTEDEVYSAGERLATRELPEYGGIDLTPYPVWPPTGWS